MANYIAWYGKKREHLTKHEREFAALLNGTPDAARLAKGIEAVRAAQIQVLKARRAVLAPSEKNTVAFSNFEREIERWRTMPAPSVVEHFRKLLRRDT
jgi:membrane carboxypeptidase/penicillin-binding protein PbpC